jgi:ankyrin repeat protein
MGDEPHFLAEAKEGKSYADKVDRAAADDAYGNGAELMMEAARKGDLDTMRYLLLERHPRVDADCRDRDGRTPIMVATASGNVNGVVQKLFRLGADIRSKDRNGRRCVHAAAANGDVALLRWFLKKGADVDAEDRRGRKPFHIAAQSGQPAVLEFIRDLKIDEMGSKGYDYLKALDAELNNALHLAAQRGSMPVVDYLDRDGDHDDKAQLRDALLRERQLEKRIKALSEAEQRLSRELKEEKAARKEETTELKLKVVEATAEVKKQKEVEAVLREKIAECQVAVESLGRAHDIEVDDMLAKLRHYRGYAF